MSQNNKELPAFEYIDQKENRFYRADWHPKKLSPFYKWMMIIHFCYLFGLPTATLVLIELFYEGHALFRYTAWLLFAMYLGMIINNLKTYTFNKGYAHNCLGDKLSFFKLVVLRNLP